MIKNKKDGNNLKNEIIGREVMENNKMKNIVILKNLPSNLVEEAIVILKTNKAARKLEYVENTVNSKEKNNENKTDYIVKEAECVLSNYINEIEHKEKTNKKTNFYKRYKSLRAYSIGISILFVLLILINA